MTGILGDACLSPCATITFPPSPTIASSPAIPGARYETACALADAVTYVFARNAAIHNLRIAGLCTTRARTTIILEWAPFFADMFELNYEISAILYPTIGSHMVSSLGTYLMDPHVTSTLDPPIQQATPE